MVDEVNSIKLAAVINAKVKPGGGYGLVMMCDVYYHPHLVGVFDSVSKAVEVAGSYLHKSERYLVFLEKEDNHYRFFYRGKKSPIRLGYYLLVLPLNEKYG